MFKSRKVLTGMEDDCNYYYLMVDLDDTIKRNNQEELESLINWVEFTINKEALDDKGKPCWKLEDLQGANLGNIEADEFEPGDYFGMIDRLDIYWKDYGIVFKAEFSDEEYKNLKFLED